MSKKPLEINPWLNICMRPRDTIRTILKFNPRFRFIILSFLYGLTYLLNAASTHYVGIQFSTARIIVVAVLGATFVGMLGITIVSALLLWTGKWFGGKGKFLPIRAAVSWSNVPSFLAIPFWGVMIYFFQDYVFSPTGKSLFEDPLTINIVTSYLIIALSIWRIVILVNCLKEVQGFSVWKGILTVVISFLIYGLFTMIISQLLQTAWDIPTVL